VLRHWDVFFLSHFFITVARGRRHRCLHNYCNLYTNSREGGRLCFYAALEFLDGKDDVETAASHQLKYDFWLRM
jgi:hypothetical protein